MILKKERAARSDGPSFLRCCSPGGTRTCNPSISFAYLAGMD